MPKDKQKDTKGLSAALKAILAESRKTLFTSIPAVVTAYDGATKRASVQPSPRTAFKDGTLGAIPILPNVPVLTPAGGGFCIAVNLVAGDAVQVVFCQRGIKAFKKTFGLEDPSGGVLDINSPVIIAGFGGLSISPTAGISLQKEDGTVKVEILDDNIKILAPVKVNVEVGASGGAEFLADGTVNFANGATSDVSGDFITKSGVSLDNHVHVVTGTTLSGAPDGEHGYSTTSEVPTV